MQQPTRLKKHISEDKEENRFWTIQPGVWPSEKLRGRFDQSNLLDN